MTISNSSWDVLLEPQNPSTHFVPCRDGCSTPCLTDGLQDLPCYQSEIAQGGRNTHYFRSTKYLLRVCAHFIHRLYFLSNDLWVSLVSWNWVLFACSQLPFLPLSSKESLLKWLLWTLSRSPEGWYRKQRVSFLYKLLGCSHNRLKFICPQQPAIGQKINGLSRDQAKHN